MTNSAKQGDEVGLILGAIDQSKVQRGMVIASPGSISAHSSFTCQFKLLPTKEGGRTTAIAIYYRPQFEFRTAVVTGTIELPGGKENLSPGDSAQVTVKLNQRVAMEKDIEFNVREGGRTVGTGRVMQIIN
jgi:elongation factor Tu